MDKWTNLPIHSTFLHYLSHFQLHFYLSAPFVATLGSITLVLFVYPIQRITLVSIFALDYLKQFTTLLVKVARFERKHRLLIQSGRWCLNRDPVSQNPGSVRVSLSASALFPRQCGNNASKSAAAAFRHFLITHTRGERGGVWEQGEQVPVDILTPLPLPFSPVSPAGRGETGET